jgi:hypothetical protein
LRIYCSGLDHSSRPICVFIRRVRSRLAGVRGHSSSRKPPQILPAPLAMHALSRPGRNPVRDFRAVPDPAIWGWILKRLPELVLLDSREDGGRAHTALPSIRQPRRPSLAVALGNLPDGPRAAARRGHNLSQRRPLCQKPDHLPAPAFCCRSCGRLSIRFVRRSLTRIRCAKLC